MEEKTLKSLEQVCASKAYERLQEKLQEGGEAVVHKVLAFLECQAQAAEPEADLQAPYRRNVSRFGDLGLKDLRVIFASFHGTLWAEQIVKRVRLPAARCLLFWAVSVDGVDFLPGSCLQHLLDALAPLYEQPRPKNQIFVHFFSSILNSKADKKQSD